MKSPIRLLLVEDEFLVREAIAVLLEREKGITLVGQADTGTAAIRLARQCQPDVILLDLRLPDKAGVELIGELRQQDAAVRILVFTGYMVPHEVAAAFRAGADGYLLKTQTITELVRAIEQTYQGLTVLDSIVAPIILGRLTRQPQPATPSLLSPCEQDIVSLMAQGLSNQAIANQLALARSTVHCHISNILHKLHLTNRTQLALYALQHGWVKLTDVVLSPTK